MNSNLSRLAFRVSSEPWLLSPERHAALQSVIESAQAVSFEMPEREAGSPYTMIGNVAAVSLSGVLAMRVTEWERFFGMADYMDLRSALEAVGRDGAADGVLLHIDSPGGSAVGCAETAAMVAEVNSHIPVVAFTDTLAASAAYWIASQAAMIVMAGSAYVGSIGVYCAVLDSSGYYAQNGLKQNLIATGAHKGLGVEGVPVTDEQIALLRDNVDSCFAEFRGTVLKARPNVKDETMQGQSVRGVDAVAAGLADEVGNMARALALVQEIIEQRKGKS